jgi:hypothetical protein
MTWTAVLEQAIRISGRALVANSSMLGMALVVCTRLWSRSRKGKR